MAAPRAPIFLHDDLATIKRRRPPVRIAAPRPVAVGAPNQAPPALAFARNRTYALTEKPTPKPNREVAKLRFEFRLKSLQTARVWIDEMPSITPAPDVSRHARLPSQRDRLSQARCVTIELKRPMGAMIGYALLGADIQPAPDGLDISVCAVGTPLGPYGKSLLHDRSDVQMGLSEEFASAVLEGLQQGVQACAPLPGASIRCDLAACDTVGSSNAMFQDAARILGQLLVMPSEPNEAQIADMLQYMDASS